MNKTNILVIGAGGQIGIELTAALRKHYGVSSVIAADIRPVPALTEQPGLFIQADALNREELAAIIKENKISQVYLLAALLSATGEKDPAKAWELNMRSLLNVLELAKDQNIEKIFWPSSIAVFGPSSESECCPQNAVQDPLTVYGISKTAGELWCQYYHKKYQLDIRSLRYPGLISHSAMPGGGTTDYAVDIFHQAIKSGTFTSFLSSGTVLPMMYMPDAIRATIELMEAPASSIQTRTSYNIAGLSFSPEMLANSIRQHIPGFTIQYNPDFRQAIADSWPKVINDSQAAEDWGWKAEYGLGRMTTDMLLNLQDKYKVELTGDKVF